MAFQSPLISVQAVAKSYQNGGVLALRWGTMRMAFDIKVEPSMRLTVTPEEATEHIGAMAGVTIDPEVHTALARVVARRKALEFVSDEEADRRTGGPADA